MMEVKEAKPKDYRQRLVNICLYYAPQKMHLIDDLLRKFKGKEEVLMATLQRGYGPEPTVQQLKAAVAQRTHSSPPAGAVPQKRPASVQPAQTVATTPLKPITVAEARVRVARYYIKYNPMKLTELDTILNTYKGQEAQLMADLKEKYGPEPEENEVNTIRHYAREFFSMPTDVRLSSRDRLIRFYIKYAPQRIPEVDKILQGYQGQENRMWFDLVEKYGPEPSLHELNIVANESENKKTYRARVVNLYQKYCPEKLLQVDAGLARHKGREDQMIQDLVRKYGPEPTDAELVQMARTGKCGHFSAQGSFRQRLINMYAFYKPEYMNRVDYGLEKYAGQEEELMGTLVRVYGPEPTRQQLDALYGNDELDFYRTQPGAQVMGACPYCAKPLTSATPGEGCCPMRASLCNPIRYMYLEHQHDKYLTVEDVLAAYNGCEEDLLNMLIAKYGPEPDAHTYTTLDALAHELITQSQQASVHASPVTQDAFQQTQLLPDAGDSERCAEDIEFEKQLKELCEVYCPEYLGDISDWIVRYRDQKEDLLSYLRKTYVSTGTEPRKLGQQEHQIGQMLCLIHQQRLDYRTRIANMYLKYRSENLAYLDEDLETYKNFEEDYLMALVCTYGPEPPLGWKPSVPSPYSEYALI